MNKKRKITIISCSIILFLITILINLFYDNTNPAIIENGKETHLFFNTTFAIPLSKSSANLNLCFPSLPVFLSAHAHKPFFN